MSAVDYIDEKIADCCILMNKDSIYEIEGEIEIQGTKYRYSIKKLK